MPRVDANNPHYPVAPDDLAIFADFLNRRFNFHNNVLHDHRDFSVHQPSSLAAVDDPSPAQVIR
jgi:hypothetical protein